MALSQNSSAPIALPTEFDIRWTSERLPNQRSLRRYVETWPQAGFEFRKQYVIIRLTSRPIRYSTRLPTQPTLLAFRPTLPTQSASVLDCVVLASLGHATWDHPSNDCRLPRTIRRIRNCMTSALA